jgi:hypothetical protein
MRRQTGAESRASYQERERPKVLWRGAKDLPTQCQQNEGTEVHDYAPQDLLRALELKSHAKAELGA